MNRWFLASVKPNQQRRSVINLQQQGVETYTPYIYFNDGRTVRKESAFPTYVFACFDPDVTSVAQINNTKGVIRLVSFSHGEPAVVQDSIIEAMQEQFDDIEVDVGFKKGDSVIISDGPLAGLKAIFKAEDSFTRVTLLMSLVSRTHEIVVDRNQVVKA